MRTVRTYNERKQILARARKRYWKEVEAKAIKEGFETKSLPFGKFKGIPLGKINDQEYLEWVREKLFSKDLAWLVRKRIESLQQAA